MSVRTSRLLRLTFFVPLLASFGCMATGWRDDFYRIAPDIARERAAFDFGCPKEQLTVERVGDLNPHGVTGCGKKAAYIVSCSGTIYSMKRESCSAALNGTIQETTAEGAKAR